MANLKIQSWPLERLRPYVNNPRKNDKAVKKVAESIRQFGFNVPITVDKDGVIATGHTRLKAAILLGLEEVPVIVLDELTPEQIDAWRLVDNQVAAIAEWDFPKLQEELAKIKNVDLSMFDFKMPSETTGLHEDDYEVNLPKEPKSKPGDVYILGKHRLMCGDATKPEDVQKLTNGKVHATDTTNASRTLLFNINTLKWDKELLEMYEKLGINAKTAAGFFTAMSAFPSLTSAENLHSVPMHDKDSEMYKAFISCLKKNDLTDWEPKHPINFYHSTTDDTVPFENYEVLMSAEKMGRYPDLVKGETGTGSHGGYGATFGVLAAAEINAMD